MKHFWQIITLLWVAVLFPLSAHSAQGTSTPLVNLPSLETKFSLPFTTLPGVSERRWFGEWWLGSGVKNFSEGKDEGTASSFRASLLFGYRLTEWARFHLDTDVTFNAGRVQTRYEDDFNPTSLRMREGYLSFGDIEVVEFRVGALSQKDLGSDLLVYGRRAFPGVREQINVGPPSVHLSFWAQQTMPTSYSLDTQREEREKTPTFLSETVSLVLKPTQELDAVFSVSHYQFNNLPAIVAFDSSALGNSTNGDVAANSDFKYGFEGFLISAEGCICLAGPLSFRFGGEWLQNTQAPSNANRGQLLFLEGNLRIKRLMKITPRYSAFFNESDTSPAYYNRWDLGNNNRKGLIAELAIEMTQYGFTIVSSYIQSAMINQDPFQFDKQVFMIGVETSHVSF